MADRYTSYAELAAREREGIDFAVRWRSGCSAYLLAAPHGGYIERGTEVLAEAIAGAEHGFYAFSGLAPRCRRLHITADNFDEPRALALAAGAQTVITLHGARGGEACVYFGGLDMALRARAQAALRAAGFRALDDPSPTRQGRGRRNICNRGRRARGLQIELPLGMRKVLFDYEPGPRRWRMNGAGRAFVAALRAAL